MWPWDTAPRFLVRDRNGIYGSAFQRIALAMGIDDVLAAPQAPWQNPFMEIVIGSLRRECLDHVIVWNERSLAVTFRRFLAYYHDWRTHLALDKDAPARRAEQPVGLRQDYRRSRTSAGLHHHDERRAA